MITYDRRAFAMAYVEANDSSVRGVDGERDGYGPALLQHRAALLAGLERLFGLRLALDSVPGKMGCPVDALPQHGEVVRGHHRPW